LHFRSETLAAGDERLQAALEAAYSAKTRPLCACTPEGVPMVIAHVGERFVLKRMPSSGRQHAPDCDSYDPPIELFGLGEVSGSAIQDDPETGATTLKLDFTLTRRGSARPPEPGPGTADSVRTDGQKLTLRGALHYLWAEAELNRWMPAMTGKRSWGVVQRRLNAAAAQKFAKGDPLSEILFIPEPWSHEHQGEIERRRHAHLARLDTGGAPGARLMLLIGELKSLEPSRNAWRAIVKHLPERPLQVAEDLYRRLQRTFSTELALWQGDESTHLILAGTFWLDMAGHAQLDSASLMAVDAHWLPLEHRWDLELTRQLVATGRRFSTGLRYNLSPDRPIARAVLTDTRGGPVALYIVPPRVTPQDVARLDALVNSSELPAWIWHAGDGDPPELPARATEGDALPRRAP
jgi:hypothetical protein